MSAALAQLSLIFADPLTLAVVAALLVIIPVMILLWNRTSWTHRLQHTPLLTPNKTEFFHRLRRALPSYQIFPPVAFVAFITDDGKLSRNARWSLRARFDRKIADYVICERGSLNIVALIELDGATHNAFADRKRDALTRAAGYQTIRFQSRQKPR